MGARENKFQSSVNLCKHTQNFIIGFISPVLLSVSYEVQHLFSSFGVARNDFFKKIFKTVVQKVQYDVNNLGTNSVHLLLELLVDSILIRSNYFFLVDLAVMEDTNLHCYKYFIFHMYFSKKLLLQLRSHLKPRKCA